MPDALEQLLRNADRSAPAAAGSPDDTANAVLARLDCPNRRSLPVHLAAVAGIVCLLLGILIPVIHAVRNAARRAAVEIQASPQALHAQPAGIPAGPDPSSFALDRQLQAHEQRLASLQVSERLAQDHARLAVLSAIPTEQALVERAADALLRQADRWAAAPAPAPSLASDTYRRVIRTFPDTAAARVARQRLNTESGKEG